MALAFEIEDPARVTLDPPLVIEKARGRLQPVGIEPEQDNVHYCVSPQQCDEAMAWALASLHYGHPVVLADKWEAESMLQNIARYKVTTCYLTPDQFRVLLSLPQEIRSAYDVSSLRHLIYGGTVCPPCVEQAVDAWCGVAILEQPQASPSRRDTLHSNG